MPVFYHEHTLGDFVSIYQTIVICIYTRCINIICFYHPVYKVNKALYGPGHVYRIYSRYIDDIIYTGRPRPRANFTYADNYESQAPIYVWHGYVTMDINNMYPGRPN